MKLPSEFDLTNPDPDPTTEPDLIPGWAKTKHFLKLVLSALNGTKYTKYTKYTK